MTKKTASASSTKSSVARVPKRITGAVQMTIGELRDWKKPEHIEVNYDDDGAILALSWLFETADGGLYRMAKKRDGIWNKAAGGWTFADPSKASKLLQIIREKHPDWPVITKAEPRPIQPLAGIQISALPLPGGQKGCLVPIPLPYFSLLQSLEGVKLVRLVGKKETDAVCLLVGEARVIEECIDSLVNQGAKQTDSLARRWQLSPDSRLQIKVSGWAVQIMCDLDNPLHYLVSPEQTYEWRGAYPYGVKVPVPWGGAISTTRKLWPQWRDKIDAAGIKWEGDDPGEEITRSVALDESRIPGWEQPAANGYTLHEYQREGVRFCTSRGMRALIGDEMGIGKTAQAIAAAEATAAQRVLVICPANARYVWEREIKGWGAGGRIQHIADRLDTLDAGARWHVVTYDQLVARTETWSLQDKDEQSAFLKLFGERGADIAGDKWPRKVKVSEPSDLTPSFSDPKRLTAWEKMMRRLRGELVQQVLATENLLIILDEAHRAKNRDAKRTQSIQRITAEERQVLLLTGTPLRNHEHEAAVLLSFLDASAQEALSKRNGYTIQDVKDYLGYYMIRRTKAEVLLELPEKTRQRIDLDRLDEGSTKIYRMELENAMECFAEALAAGASDAEARQEMRPAIEKARTALGLAKVLSGDVADLIVDVVENKGCCVAFCAHHQVSDTLRGQLEKAGIKAAVVDGRTAPRERARIVDDFQAGMLDVFIGGIHAAGEAITLTRADTVIFAELDWVPAALLQAEDRIHRSGQKRNCQVLQVIAQMESENLDEMMIDIIESKLKRIGEVLNEDAGNIIDQEGSIQAELYRRLLKRPPTALGKPNVTKPRNKSTEVPRQLAADSV